MSRFVQVLSHLNKGGSLTEIDEKLAEAVRQCRVNGKAAKLTITLDLKPDDGIESETIKIVDKITLKTADPVRKPSTFFTTEDGGLSRTNPKQGELPLRSIEGGKSENPPQPVAAVQ